MENVHGRQPRLRKRDSDSAVIQPHNYTSGHLDNTPPLRPRNEEDDEQPSRVIRGHPLPLPTPEETIHITHDDDEITELPTGKIRPQMHTPLEAGKHLQESRGSIDYQRNVGGVKVRYIPL